MQHQTDDWKGEHLIRGIKPEKTEKRCPIAVANNLARAKAKAAAQKDDDDV